MMNSVQANILVILINAHTKVKVALAETKKIRDLRGSSGPNFDRLMEEYEMDEIQTKKVLVQYINSLVE